MTEHDHDIQATQAPVAAAPEGQETVLVSRPLKATGGAMFCPFRGVSAKATQRLDSDTARLLQVRLKALTIFLGVIETLAAARFALLQPAAAVVPAVMAVVSAVAAVILWRKPRLPYGQLKLIKTLVFGLLVGGLTVNIYMLLGGALAAGDTEFAIAYINRIPGIWMLVMLAYAIFMPASWRSALAFVGVCIAADFGIYTALRIVHGPSAGVLDPGKFTETASYAALVLFAAGGLAVFGTYIIGNYRRSMAEMGDAGMYELVAKIGAGGMGEVWKAEHRLLARPAAIKMIRSDLLEGAGRIDPATVTGRFEREARATATLESPHTVQLYDFGVTGDGTFFYVMEFLRGLDLDDLVRKFGPVTPARAVYLMQQAAQSLQEAHDRGMVHRDIKPGNLHVGSLAGDYDWVKVLDFGLVKSFQDQGENSLQLTQEGMTTGTPAYFPPEMAQAASVADGRADIYALAAVTYWLLTGQLVFEGAGPMDMVVKHIRDTPEPPSSRVETPISASLDAAILKGLEKDPGARPQSMREFARILGEADIGPAWTQSNAVDWWRLHLPDEAPARVA